MKKLVLLSVLAIFMLAPMAMASPATFYGRVCITTAVAGVDKEYSLDNTDYSYTEWDNLWSNDFRLGADFKVNDNVSAKVEMRAGGTAGGGGSVSVRHWYGLWNFGAGKLLVGRFWAPTFQAITGSNFIDGEGDVQGSLREDGLQLWFDVGGGSLKFAALTPATTGYSAPGVTAIWGYTGRSYYKLPKLEVSYNHAFGPLDMNFFAGYQSVEEEEDVVLSPHSESIDSHLFGLTVAWNPKPAYVKGAAYMAQNLDLYGWAGGGAIALVDFVSTQAYDSTGGIINDTLSETDYLGWVVCAGFVVNDRFEIEGGWVHLESEQDFSYTSGYTDTYEASLDEFYVVATYKLADSVYVYPEIAIGKRGDDTWSDNTATPSTAVDRGGFHRYGIYWRINF